MFQDDPTQVPGQPSGVWTPSGGEPPPAGGIGEPVGTGIPFQPPPEPSTPIGGGQPVPQTPPEPSPAEPVIPPVGDVSGGIPIEPTPAAGGEGSILGEESDKEESGEAGDPSVPPFI